ncbi:hypothetical protein [Streptomyces roseochromogenus]|uniref:Uncharacterized protein n=1 Tax=Streptomyces roseochromogenus subsp. oscitans DS 12.976 TaxID=1352936 RepID=V6KDS2_STRRC|nr:hypothetical protein [Streptomyces roseochromogenus]EST27149.1 hypothetical protein M878_25920 [Streptomyces roseochromogenus subsp. oscitans DS 12.976]
MYRRSSSWLLNELRLVPALEHQDLIGYGPAAAGIAFASNAHFTPPSGGSVVVGGACLTNCAAQVDRLRVEFVADTLQPLLLAAWAGVPCVLFLPIGEEILVSDPAVSPSAWQDFGQRLEGFVNRIAAAIPGGRPPVLVRTDRKPVSSALDSAADAITAVTPGGDIEDLYTIRASKPSRKPPSAARLRQYRRSIVTYLPAVVSDLVGFSVEHVVVAENLHQAKAISTARTVMEATGARERLDHLAHVPSPSVSGTGRMARAEERSTVFCLDSAESRAEKVRRMSASVRWFWESVCPDPLLPETAAHGGGRVRAAFDEWHRLLSEVSSGPAARDVPSRTPHHTFEGATR